MVQYKIGCYVFQLEVINLKSAIYQQNNIDFKLKDKFLEGGGWVEGAALMTIMLECFTVNIETFRRNEVEKSG